ncbi:MAG TPA: hypothetical protein VFZ53_22080 [Polyangiaceae bacterium]
MTEDNEDLVRRAETALAGLVLREPDWDAFAGRIDDARANATPSDEAALFDAPLPATSDDGDGLITAAAVDSVPAPRESGEVVRHAPADAPAPSVAPASSDELDQDWASTPHARSAPVEPRVPSPLPEAPPAAAITDVVAEAEDLTAHAATEDSAPVAAVDPTPSRREPVSLAELARASVARRGTREKASIAMESLAVAQQSRAQGEQIAQRVQAAASHADGAPGSVPPPPITERRPRRARSELMRGPWPGVVIGGLGLAAAFALHLSRPTPAPVTIVQHVPQTPAVAADAPREPVPAPAPKPQATDALEQAREAAIDPTSLPALPRGAAPRAEGKSAEPAPGAVAKAPVPPPAPAAVVPGARASGQVAAENIVLEEDPKAVAKATPSAPVARPADTKLRPAELSSAAMTERPSAGAAQAAVGAVLGAARSCVAGHSQPSTAQLVFGSDGQVSSVTVAGAAAGTPAAACIESALKKARVQPFAASSFSLAVTVRPP